MFKQIDYVMIGVSKMDQSVEFYKDTLGLPLKYKTNEWSEFQTGATTLALHLSKPRTAATTPQEGLLAGTLSIGFNVTDLENTYRELKSKGVEFAIDLRDAPWGGGKYAIFKDLDGNKFWM